MTLTPEQQEKVNRLAGRGPVAVCELRGQKQASGMSADKKDSSKKNEFHYLELSLEFVETGEHVKADFFGPRDQKGPVPMVEAPKGSILVVAFGSYVSDFNATKGRVKEFQVLQRASYAAVGAASVETPATTQPKAGGKAA